MSAPSDLERSYRRLLAWYPRAFRLRYEEEMVTVLMAGSGADQRRPSRADSLDLIRGAVLARLRLDGRRPPSTVFAAVWLMCIGAAVELGTLITVVLTLGDLKSAVLQSHPGLTAAQWQDVFLTHILPIEIVAPIAVVLWLLLAWANYRGLGWARVVFAVFFAATTLKLLFGLSQGSAVHATADLVAGAALWAVMLAVFVLIVTPVSRRHYAGSATTS